MRLQRIIIAIGLAALLAASGATPDAPASAQSGACAGLVAPALGDCLALVELYEGAGGAGWRSRAGWLDPAVPHCAWSGVTCAGGRVRELRLPANGLTGGFPASVARLDALSVLDLRANQLRGVVPPAVCSLPPGLALDLGLNALSTRRADLRACLNGRDPDWAVTQTTPPAQPLPEAVGADRVTLRWQPAPYQGPGAYYEVSYATEPDGPFVLHGRTADAGADRYTLDGLAAGSTFYLAIRTVSPAHADHPDELRSEAVGPPVVTRGAAPTLLVVYFPADNDLSQYVPLVRDRLRLGTRLNPNVTVIYFSDGDGPADTRVERIAEGVAVPTDAVAQRWGRDELNSADPEVLAWLLTYARAAVPAEREIVSLMGHGVALAPELSFADEPSGPAPGVRVATARPSATLPPLPKGLDATPGDVTDRGYLSTVGLGRALSEATEGGARPFDLIFFDQCFQGNLDTLYEVRGAAEGFIASPNYAWLSAPYHQYLPLMAPDASVEAIALRMIARYQQSLGDGHPNVIFAVRRADLETLAAATSQLGAALRRAVLAGERQPIAAATFSASYVDTTQCGRQNLKLAPPDELIGLGGFARALAGAFPPGDAYGVSAALADVEAALAQVRKTSRQGVPHIAPDEFWDYDNTFTVLAPLPANSPDTVAWRSTLYTDQLPLPAVWAPDPTVAVSVTASLAFVRDGQWDEFLAAWYAPNRQATVGEWCRYIPPALVPGTITQAITLSAEPLGPGALRLSWTPPADEEVAAYAIHRDGPVEVGWSAGDLLGPAATTVELRSLVPGATYRLRIVAEDADGVARAVSPELVVTVPGEVLLFLPLIRR
jgi:hypothetical protein